MRTVYCGYGRAGMECLCQLMTEADFDPQSLLIYTHSMPENSVFADFLEKMKLPYRTQSINDDVEQLRAFRPQMLLSVYYRTIIRSRVLDLVQGCAMNLHPSLLPEYKGCFSSVWAILNGEKETGITFHSMTEDVDSGNILLQKKLKISSQDTAYSLYHKLVSLFSAHFKEAVGLLRGKFAGYGQSPEGSEKYYPRQVPYDGILTCSETTFEYACRFVRAMYFPPFPSAKFQMPEGIVECADINSLWDLKSCFKTGANHD